jgi:hypothetical protein
MPVAPTLALTDADVILTSVEELARSVFALKQRRGTITAALRKRIGERDGWRCRNCGLLVDPELRWQ